MIYCRDDCKRSVYHKKCVLENGEIGPGWVYLYGDDGAMVVRHCPNCGCRLLPGGASEEMVSRRVEVQAK